MLSKKFEKIFLWTMIVLVLVTIYTCLFLYSENIINVEILVTITMIAIFILPIYFLIIRPITITIVLFHIKKFLKEKQPISAYEYIKKQFNKNPNKILKASYTILAIQNLDYDNFYWIYNLEKPQNINGVESIKIIADFLSNKTVNMAELDNQLKYDKKKVLSKINYIIKKEFTECLSVTITSQNDFYTYISARCDIIAKQQLGQDYSREDTIISDYEKNKQLLNNKL